MGRHSNILNRIAAIKAREAAQKQPRERINPKTTGCVLCDHGYLTDRHGYHEVRGQEIRCAQYLMRVEMASS